jgi:hypothetical protein
MPQAPSLPPSPSRLFVLCPLFCDALSMSVCPSDRPSTFTTAASLQHRHLISLGGTIVKTIQ